MKTTSGIDVYLEGTATFVRLPQLAKVFEQIPAGTKTYLHLEMLSYIDHSCLDFLLAWEKQQQQTGSRLVVNWDELVERYNKPLSPRRTKVVA